MRLEDYKISMRLKKILQCKFLAGIHKIYMILFIIVLLFGFIFLNNPKEIKATWWNDSWNYRQVIPVTNNTSEETDVYIIVTLDTDTASTSMQSDCGDFRFIKENGQALPYYIVSGCQTDTNIIHINFDIFPTGAQTVYFYYGNPSAENGFSATDFTTVASDYTIGAIQTEETGPGPVGYWSFDSGYGTTAQDSSANNNDGTITGATWQDESMCISGKCLYFDGSGDYVEITNDASLNFGDEEEFSISTWVKFVGTDSDQVIYRTANTGNRWYIERKSTGKIRFQSYADGGDIYSDSFLNDNKWHYISVNQDDAGAFTLYIDGNQEGTQSYIVHGSVTNTDDYRIGARQGDTEYFNGFIDEVKIYPYARTADQIRQDYNAGLAGMGSTHGVSASFGGTSDKWMSDGLVGYWQMDESATTSGAVDASGNGNDGTYYGDASTTAGKYGNGGVFDQDADYVDLGDLDNMTEGQSGLSVSAWVKADDADSTQQGTIVSKKGSGIDTFELYWTTTEDISFVAYTTDLTATASFTDGIPFGHPDKWYHIVGVYNGVDARVYVDGVLGDTVVDLTGMTRSSTFDINIGANSDSNLSWDGQIDEVRIYNRALNPTEVRRLYEWAPGPVAHWKFDEKSGTTAYDSIASSSFAGGNDGTISGATWARGKYGSALSFDGGSDYVDAGNFNFASGDYTLSAWIKTTQTSISSILARGGINFAGGDTGVRFELEADGQVHLHISDGSTNDLIASTDTVNNGEWHHVAAVRNGSEAYIYVDNSVDSDLSMPSGDCDYNNIMAVGRAGHSDQRYFDGLIDDVRIYNYARTQKQILEDMNAGAPAIKSPVLDLHFDEGYGETVHSAGSGQALTGTLYPGSGGTNTATSAMWTKNGKFGQAIEFDGVDDYSIFNFQFSIFKQFSISKFINWQTLATSEPIIAQWGGNQNAVLIKSDNTNSDELRICVASGLTDDCTNYGATVGADLSASTWYNLQVIYDGDKTGNSNRLKLYINGKQQTLSFTGTIPATFPDSSENLEIGGDIDLAQYSNVLIDEVKIYNYALSVDEVKTLYNSGQAAVMGQASSADDDGTTVTGAGTEYCIPGDTATCSPPVLELKFDEKTGTTTYDTSGQGNDGVFVNTASSPTWTRGKYGSGLSFDGSSDYVDVGNFNFASGNYTLSAWIKTTQTSIGAIVYRAGDSFAGGDSGVRLHIQAGGILEFHISDGSTNDSVGSTNTANDGEWHHIAAVRNGTEAYIYVDNSVDSDLSMPSGDCDYNNIMAVGRAGHLDLRKFDGLIDQVHIYDYARTPAQIAWDYNKGKPIGHWKFDECSGGTIHDATQNKEHGTLHLGTAGVTATGTCASSSNSFWYNGKDGKINSAGSFGGDGEDDWIDLGSPSELDITDEMTVSAWIKPSSLAAQRVIIAKYDGGFDGDDSFIFSANNDELEFHIRTDINTAEAGEKIGLVAGEWQHVLGVFDGSELKAYINGEAGNSNSYSGTIRSNPSEPIFIGAATNGAYEFGGLIDEVKIFNYALTSEQVKTEFNGGAVRFGQ